MTSPTRKVFLCAPAYGNDEGAGPGSPTPPRLFQTPNPPRGATHPFPKEWASLRYNHDHPWVKAHVSVVLGGGGDSAHGLVGSCFVPHSQHHRRNSGLSRSGSLAGVTVGAAISCSQPTRSRSSGHST